MSDSIETLGHPLAFKYRQGANRPGVVRFAPARDVFVVEARQLEGHQKEAVVSEGRSGSIWRLVSDEGKHLRGSDLAPFPLGFFNAGLHADLTGRILELARARSITVGDLRMDLDTFYYMTGSFFKGDGIGYAEPAEVNVHIASSASSDVIERLVADAVIASPAFATMRIPVTSTFAIYSNGRRRPVATVPESTAADATDPFETYRSEPAPGGGHLDRLVRKTGQVAEGEVTAAPTGTTTRIIRTVAGTSRLRGDRVIETDTVLGLPGMSHFTITADESGADLGPTGLAHLSAAVAFCFMTQLSRYIEHMGFPVRGVRLVQYAPYTLDVVDGAIVGGVEPFDTHLFLGGAADLETKQQLMEIAARTCYLHSTLAAALEPRVTVHHTSTE